MLSLISGLGFFFLFFLNFTFCVQGQVLRPALDPEPLCDAHVHLYAGRKALSEGPGPEHLSVETGTRFTHANLDQFYMREMRCTGAVLAF